ncbi:MAG: NUDIX hydrolase [Myxococcota bacterium]|nr:NUDIX hydrolase [Myxococcota bacterium]
MTSRTPPLPRPSATILLLRDGPAGLEVFMVQRHHQIDFATGALVFPGGKVDPGDADPRLVERARRGAGPARDAFPIHVAAIHVAAIRETFEESGVLLARPRGSDALVDAERLSGLDPEREKLEQGDLTLADLCEREDLELALDLLEPFAHWITPEFMPKRFDTHFFLVPAPKDHLAAHDGRESVDSVWISPREAAADAEAGRRTIIFPTLMNVKKLARSDSVEAALGAARSGPVVTVLPRVEVRDGEKMMVLPEAAGYDVSVAPLSALR